MDDVINLLVAWRWPGASVLIALAVSRALTSIARHGIRVEIYTRQPILVGTGRAPLRAEVGKVRI